MEAGTLPQRKGEPLMSIAATTVNVKIAIEKTAVALLLATALISTCLLMVGTGADLPMLLP
jgi:hypothetical protein